MRIKKYIVPLICILGSLIACDSVQKDIRDKDKAIARVYDRYLYPEDVQDLLEGLSNSEDSGAVLSNYINLWAKEQLILYKAEFNLNDNQKDFERQIQDYKNDLLSFTYQQEYIKQNLDTIVSIEDIEEYYSNYKESFLLKENILKVNYMVISSNAPKLKSFIQKFKNNKLEDLEELESYALNYARDFSFNDTSWVPYDKLLEIIPLEIYNQIQFIRSNKLVQIEKDNKMYLLLIRDYKIKASSSPIAYVKPIIQNIILNKRILRLLEELEKSLIEDAVSKKEFETYHE